MTPAEYREQIYNVLSESDQTVEARINRALDIGVEYLGLPIGFCTRIDADTQNALGKQVVGQIELAL